MSRKAEEYQILASHDNHEFSILKIRTERVAVFFGAADAERYMLMLAADVLPEEGTGGYKPNGANGTREPDYNGLTVNQHAAIKALKSRMDGRNVARVKSTEFHDLAGIAQGSVHGVLKQLAGKGLISILETGTYHVHG